jgi:hypothetical protein
MYGTTAYAAGLEQGREWRDEDPDRPPPTLQDIQRSELDTLWINLMGGWAAVEEEFGCKRDSDGWRDAWSDWVEGVRDGWASSR